MEDPFAQAERRFREGKERVARQIAVIEQMERDHRPLEAAQARAVLMAIQDTLEVMQRHLDLERERKAQP